MHTVLIVEDGDNVAPLEIALGSITSVEIQVLRNGREALKLLESDLINLSAVVTDLNLPYVDGFQLVAAIRSHKRYSQVPIIVISGEGQKDIPERLRSLGANAFFTKPYSPAQIRQTVEELIREI